MILFGKIFGVELYLVLCGQSTQTQSVTKKKFSPLGERRIRRKVFVANLSASREIQITGKNYLHVNIHTSGLKEILACVENTVRNRNR